MLEIEHMPKIWMFEKKLNQISLPSKRKKKQLCNKPETAMLGPPTPATDTKHNEINLQISLIPT